MTQKTGAQLQADWITHGNIARMQAQLDRETNAGKRKVLEELLVEQRKLISPG
ncbi:MAG: hypothetical protein RJB58_1896 [Pseudomonadota bacterium]|jgi:hypothetical protein